MMQSDKESRPNRKRSRCCLFRQRLFLGLYYYSFILPEGADMLKAGKEKGLNSNQLKLIAIAAMTLDHLTWTLFPGYSREWFVIVFHVIGRLTAPIMWFFVAEGYHYTHNIKKYAARLFFSGSDIPLCIQFLFRHTFHPLSVNSV